MIAVHDVTDYASMAAVLSASRKSASSMSTGHSRAGLRKRQIASVHPSRLDVITACSLVEARGQGIAIKQHGYADLFGMYIERRVAWLPLISLPTTWQG